MLLSQGTGILASALKRVGDDNGDGAVVETSGGRRDTSWWLLVV